MRRTERGFTIVEMIVVLSIFLGAALLIYQVAQSLMISYRTGETKIQVEENLRRGMTHLMRELRQAARATLMCSQGGSASYPAGDSITYRVPEDLDANGTVLDAFGNVEYGLYPITFRRDSQNQLLRAQDRNGNGIPEAAIPGEIMVIAQNIASVDFFLTDLDRPNIRVTLVAERKVGQDTFRHTLQETAIPRN